MRLYHNIASLNVYKEQNKVLAKQSNSIERISSGYKINSAKEDPNSVAQSERLRMQIKGVQMAARNVQDGASMLQTADAGLDSITQMLQRIRELVVQSGSDANDIEAKGAIQKEISQLMQGIDGVAESTEFNGVKLIHNQDVIDNGKPGILYMPSGANVGERIEIPCYNLAFNSGAIKMSDGTYRDLSKLDISNGTSINDALGMIDSSIDTVLSVRSHYGALVNRFEDSYQGLGEIGERLQGAESAVRDADVASETVEFAKNNLLVEASNAMLVQTNRLPQDILRVLENMRR